MNTSLDIITVLTGVISAATAVLGVWIKIKYDEKTQAIELRPRLA